MAQFNPAPVDMDKSDEVMFLLQRKRFEKMATIDGEMLRFKLEIKVKRASE